VRLSGPDALLVASALLVSRDALERQPSHTLRRIALVDRESGAAIDDAMCAVMRAPRSYTGEDVVELSCHGGPALLAMVVTRLCRAGARLAEPGEFTRRAFVNGRLDLARAEAVALLISARTERAVTLAARALEGDLGAQIRLVHETLLDVVAGLEVRLDFPDDGEGCDLDAARGRVARLADELGALVAAARRGRLVYDGVTVALVGPPNAGKSSLLNALLGRDRAIVSPTPGTTRDVVDGTVEIAGVPVRLLDTAGLATPSDAVEAEGMRRTRRALEESDIAVLVIDGSRGRTAEQDALQGALGGRRTIVVRSKADLGQDPAADVGREAVVVSATTGTGLAVLRECLGREVARVIGEGSDEGEVAASLRQIELLEQVAMVLQKGTIALSEQPLEVALIELREALRGTAALLGIELGESVLNRIFSTFCVGK
jgi:tRNA modification GTPase